MTREIAIRTLFVQWIIIAALPIALVAAQSIAGKYGDDSELAWNWLVGQFAPTLAILTAAVFSDPSKTWRRAPANMWRWRTAFWLGIAQAFVLLSVLLIEPLTGIDAFELFSKTQVGLSILQGIVVAAVGSVIFDGR